MIFWHFRKTALKRKCTKQAIVLPNFRLAGVAGFEPANVGIRIQCLTTWRHPIKCDIAIRYGVIEEDRTLDLQSHNLAFYQLNYDHHKGFGAPSRIRTCDLCLRRALLYPAELWKHLEQVKGIGPSRPAWKAGVLPLNYTCTFRDCVIITQQETFVNNFK